MFALCSIETIEEESGLYFAAGSCSLVECKISKLKKRFHVMKELLLIQSDLNVINDFKHKLKSSAGLVWRKDFIKMVEDTENSKKLVGIVFDIFLDCFSCNAKDVEVCQKCQIIVKQDNLKTIGKVLTGENEVGDCFQMKRNWKCKECSSPFEFTLIAWALDGRIAPEGNYSAIVGERQCIQNRLKEIRRQYPDAQVVLSINPTVKSKEVSSYIKNKFLPERPHQITNDNKMVYQEVILETFLDYFIKDCKSKKKSVLFCDKCCHIFLKKGEKGIGELFAINKEVIGSLELGPYTCSKCETSPLILYALEADGSLDYYVSTNKRDRIVLCRLERRYTRIYPFFKFLCPYVNGEFIKKDICQLKSVSTQGNVLQTKLGKTELITAVKRIYQKVVFSRDLIYTHRICMICNRGVCIAYQRHFGSNWSETSKMFVSQDVVLRKYDYQCSWHKIRNILYCEMETFNTLCLLEDDTKQVFNKSDIICLFCAENAMEKDIVTSGFLQNRLIFSESTQRGRSGLTMLIKNNLIFKHEKLSYSTRGLFLKLELATYRMIVGVVFWPDADEGLGESIDDWLAELEEIIRAHNDTDIKFIIGGNFNCRVGDLNNCFKDETVFWNGNLSLKRSSHDYLVDNRGERLTALMNRHSFILCNGRTASDCPGKSTCKSGSDHSVSELVWVNSCCGYDVQDMSILQLCPEGMERPKAAFLELKDDPG